MTVKRLRALGFEATTPEIEIAGETVQFWKWADGSQYTVTLRPQFALAPHQHGEYSPVYTSDDLANGWPPPIEEPVIAPELSKQQSLF